jgi:hypothetical protein
MTVDQLKSALIADGSEQEQSALIAANPALITPAFASAIEDEGLRLQATGRIEPDRMLFAAKNIGSVYRWQLNRAS